MVGAELMKAGRKKRTWVLVGLLAVVVPLVQLVSAAFVASRVGGSFLDQGGAVGGAVEQIAAPFAMARNNLGATLQPLLLVFAAIFAAFLVGEERGYRMWKVILTSSPDRPRVLAAKFAAGMILLGAVVLGTLAGSVVFGGVGVALGLSGGFGGDWGTLLALYLLQWLVLAAPLALGFLISWLVAAPAMAVIGVVVLPGLIETLVRGAMLAQLNQVSLLNAPFQAARLRATLETVPRYFLTPNLNLGTGYLGGAVRSAFGEVPSAVPRFDWGGVGWSVTVCAVYFALFAALLAWSFSRRDVHD
jgi:ABC-type transport system involved in multi-copper enzyme maturation permease subunit